MCDYVDIRERRPEEGQVVHIITKDSYDRSADGAVNHATAVFQDLTDNDSPFDDGPYRFHGDCGMTYDARVVLYWMPTKEPDGLRDNTQYKEIHKCNLINEQRHKKRMQEMGDSPAWKSLVEQSEQELIETLAKL